MYSKLLIKFRYLNLLGLAIFVTNCAEDPKFLQTSKTQFFNQKKVVRHLDVLWVLDDRSPMHKIKDHLVKEASLFFSRLDAISVDYRMAITTMDMTYNKGKIKPSSQPFILTKGYGTAGERIDFFSKLFVGTLINLNTGAENKGFLSSYTALTQYFSPKEGTPLVLVYISDGDDKSPSLNTQSAVSSYGDALLSLKQNDPNKIRIYSVNYTASSRCATEYNTDISKSDFEDRYFSLARRFNGVTADVCTSFANQIDLSGSTLGTLETRFKLNEKANPSSIQVTVTVNNEKIESGNVSYDEATQEIVFEVAPPADAVIQVVYQTI